jgi:hyperosmotically inducible periplasmic protein
MDRKSKSSWLRLALCACLAAPLTGYAAGEKSVDGETRGEKAKEAIGDAAITTKVKAAILADRMLKVMQIKVDTEAGVVNLSGAVDTPEAVTHATDVVKKIKGVKSVNNKLEVKSKTNKGSDMMEKGSGY